MSADKRTVATDALETLGMIIGENEARDAIHLAVEPVEAADLLYPGQDVKLSADGKAIRATQEDGLGIVDPFLRSQIYPGQRFWLVVYPRQIRSLRHVWEHPAFPTSTASSLPKEKPEPVVATSRVEDSRRWIQDYAARLTAMCDIGDVVTYEDLMDEATSVANGGYGYLSRGGAFEGETFDPEFWVHFTVVTGIVPKSTELYFSCSC
jgi:hypothetical protein